MAKILVLDDERDFREGLMETLTDLGHVAVGARSSEEGLLRLEHDRFDLLLVDFRMPGRDGVESMKFFRERLGEDLPPIVMITAFSDSRNTIEAMRLGAFDHLTKPVGKAEIERVVAAALKSHPQVAATSDTADESLVGRSEAMREVLKMVGRLAATDTTVLISGETGTGKEVVARTIHESSARARGPFVALNCAAIPENLLESELFGHVKGAFTGAVGDRPGSFRLAHGGTLFLDEIGDMNPSLQAKMLRAVQEREITPVGANKPLAIDCRLLAATHRDLRQMIARGEFREDLYYRLNVVQLHLPPLRERPDDIEPLARSFSKGHALSEAALDKLRRHAWPGNVRELRNVLERATVLAHGAVIDADDVRLLDAREVDEDSLDWHASIAGLERRLLERALREAGGNRSEAARRLGIQRQLLYAKMKEHHVDV